MLTAYFHAKWCNGLDKISIYSFSWRVHVVLVAIAIYLGAEG